MPYKDPQKAKEARQRWYLKNKDKHAEYCKRWEEDHKDRRREQHKEWYENNREEILAKNKQWYKTEQGIKSQRIKNWKQKGIIHDDFDTVYDNYINTKECDVCKVELTEGRGKNCRNLDHYHETGKIRGIICKKCNVTDVLGIKNKSKNY